MRGGLGALSQSWVAAEAAKPCFGDLWVALSEGPEWDDYGSGQYAEQALRRLSDRLRERRGSASG